MAFSTPFGFTTWAEHVQQVGTVLESLRQAGLTANPGKCAVGWKEVWYLGYHLGGGQVRPQVDKTAAIPACPQPKTKKEVRRFLGLAGYYRRFIPNFADLTSPLTDLTRKVASDPVQWTEQCQLACYEMEVFTRTKTQTQREHTRLSLGARKLSWRRSREQACTSSRSTAIVAGRQGGRQADGILSECGSIVWNPEVRHSERQAD
ncbi:uncharacterized protein [Brachyistius frenatus]|uniref:uncharacterized protein n=1 Tax=Brachyistius frenatus TaxID=100188 RepID=UPI0037E955D7